MAGYTHISFFFTCSTPLQVRTEKGKFMLDKISKALHIYSLNLFINI